MTSVLLIIHAFVTLALIGVVLIQRSEGGGLGVGTSAGMGSFMGGRGTANLLTRTTAVLGTLFLLLALALALLSRGTSGVGGSLLDSGPAAPPVSSAVPGAPVPAPSVPPAASAPAAPSPAAPSPAAPTPAAQSPAASSPAAQSPAIQSPAPPAAAPAAPSVPTN